MDRNAYVRWQLERILENYQIKEGISSLSLAEIFRIGWELAPFNSREEIPVEFLDQVRSTFREHHIPERGVEELVDAMYAVVPTREVYAKMLQAQYMGGVYLASIADKSIKDILFIQAGKQDVRVRASVPSTCEDGFSVPVSYTFMTRIVSPENSKDGIVTTYSKHEIVVNAELTAVKSAPSRYDIQMELEQIVSEPFVIPPRM